MTSGVNFKRMVMINPLDVVSELYRQIQGDD